MVSGHYVPNYAGMIGNAAAGIIGQMREKDLMQQAQEAAAAQQAAQQEWMAQMPTGQAAIAAQQMGPGAPVEMGGGEGTVEGPAPTQPGQAAKPPTEQEIAAWAAQGAGINPAIAGAVQSKLMEKNLDRMFPKEQGFMQVAGGVFDPKTGTFHISPEAQADAEARRENTRQMTELRIAQLEWQKENANLNREQKAELAQQAADLRRELRSMRSGGDSSKWVPSGNVDAEGRPILYDKNDPSKTMVVGAGGAAASAGVTKATYAKAQEAVGEAESGLSDLRATVKNIEANPGAYGKLPRVADFSGVGALQSFAAGKLTPEERQTRATAGNINSEWLHKRFGAALTANELARAADWIPLATDSAEVRVDKYKALMSYVQTRLDEKKKLAGKAAESAGSGVAEAELRKKYGL
jgi:hypothetical protein